MEGVLHMNSRVLMRSRTVSHICLLRPSHKHDSGFPVDKKSPAIYYRSIPYFSVREFFRTHSKSFITFEASHFRVLGVSVFSSWWVGDSLLFSVEDVLRRRPIEYMTFCFYIKLYALTNFLFLTFPTFFDHVLCLSM